MISSTQIDRLFTLISPQQSDYDNLANNALGRGIDLYQKEDYSGAIREFKKSAALSPSSENTDKAYEYMAYAYLNQDKVAEAADTYRLIIRRNPSDDSARLSLGNIYFKDGRYKEALQEYSMAVRINPNSAANRYALGQTYMMLERYQEAETQFRRAAQLSPNDPNAYDALGQALSRSGRYDDAVIQFEKAIQLDKNFTDAYVSLGYTYADMGEMEKARNQLEILSKLDPGKTADLADYIKTTSAPRIINVFSTDGFPLYAKRKTMVSTLDDALTVPNGSKDFTLAFIFSKEMDVSSITNPSNWRISRATGKNPGGAYNWGLPLPSTEAPIPAMPYRIAYVEGSLIAGITFRIDQNDSADGTIDPSHMVFQFRGTDAYGKAMDPKADEYSSVSKVV